MLRSGKALISGNSDSKVASSKVARSRRKANKRMTRNWPMGVLLSRWTLHNERVEFDSCFEQFEFDGCFEGLLFVCNEAIYIT